MPFSFFLKVLSYETAILQLWVESQQKNNNKKINQSTNVLNC